MAHSVDDIAKKLEEIKITDDIFCGEDLTYEKELFELNIVDIVSDWRQCLCRDKRCAGG